MLKWDEFHGGSGQEYFRVTEIYEGDGERKRGCRRAWRLGVNKIG